MSRNIFKVVGLTFKILLFVFEILFLITVGYWVVSNL